MSLFSKLGASGFMAVIEKIAAFFANVLSIIPKTLYLLVTFCMQIVDLIQVLFQKLAGLDVYYIKGSNVAQEGDFVIYFLRKVLFEKGTLNTAFWSIAILGLFLLVFATLIAVLRTQYNYDDKPVSPMKVVGKAVKSFLSFAVIPIVAFFGVELGNIFLRALNSATIPQVSDVPIFSSNSAIKLEPYTLSDGSQTYRGITLFDQSYGINTDTFSGMVFRSAAYKANRIRNDADFRALCEDASSEIVSGTSYTGITMGLFNVVGDDYETAASRLDDAFVYNYQLNRDVLLNTEKHNRFGGNLGLALTTVLSLDFTNVGYRIPTNTFNRYNVSWIWFYYDLWQFDFVISIAAIIIIGVIYFNIVTAMMKRAIELTMLMIVSPGVVAITPLDDGAMLKKWKGNFLKKTLSAYGAVVGVNLLFLVLPIIKDINFFNIPIMDAIVQLMFTIVGLSTVKDVMSMFSEMVGGEDANKVGGETNKAIMDNVKKVGAIAAKAAVPAARMLGATPMGLAARGVVKGVGALGSGVKNLADKGIAKARDKNDEKRATKELSQRKNNRELEDRTDQYMWDNRVQIAKGIDEEFRFEHGRDVDLTNASDVTWYEGKREEKRAAVKKQYADEKSKELKAGYAKERQEKHEKRVRRAKSAGQFMAAPLTFSGAVLSGIGSTALGGIEGLGETVHSTGKTAKSGKLSSAFSKPFADEKKSDKEKSTEQQRYKDEAERQDKQTKVLNDILQVLQRQNLGH